MCSGATNYKLARARCGWVAAQHLAIYHSIRVEITITERTGLAITGVRPKLGAIIKRAISHQMWVGRRRADGGEQPGEATLLALALQLLLRSLAESRATLDLMPPWLLALEYLSMLSHQMTSSAAESACYHLAPQRDSDRQRGNAWEMWLFAWRTQKRHPRQGLTHSLTQRRHQRCKPW